MDCDACGTLKNPLNHAFFRSGAIDADAEDSGGYLHQLEEEVAVFFVVLLEVAPVFRA